MGKLPPNPCSFEGCRLPAVSTVPVAIKIGEVSKVVETALCEMHYQQVTLQPTYTVGAVSITYRIAK